VNFIDKLDSVTASASPRTTLLENTAATRPPIVGLRPWIEKALLLIFIVAFVPMALVPAWSNIGADFPNYYLAARLYRQGYPLDKVYDWVCFQREWDHMSDHHNLVSFQPLTLFSALPIVPFSSLPHLPARRCWVLLNVVILLLTTMLLVRCTSMGWVRVLLLMFLAFFPLRSNFLYGQMHILVLLLLTIAAFLYLQKCYFWSGFTLAGVAALKIYPILFLVFFIIKKRWGAAVGLAVGLSATALLSIYLFGVDASRVYAYEVLPWAMRSQIINPYNVAWGSLNALLARLLIAEPELNPTPIAHLPWLSALLYSLIVSCIVAVFLRVLSAGVRQQGIENQSIDDQRARGTSREKLEWAAYLFLLLFLSSQPAPYHFVVLILPAVLVTDYLLEGRKTTAAAALIVVYVLACGFYNRLLPAEPTGWRMLLAFPRLFFLLLFGGLLLGFLSVSLERYEPRSRSRAWLVPAVAFLVMFVAGFVSQLRHFRGQFDNYASRVVIVPGAATATDPVIGSDGLFFTALLPRFLASAPDTYAVHKLKDNAINSFASGTDWFHPAAGKDRDRAWAEVATTGGSRIVRFNPAASVNSLAQVTVEVEDAEEPVLSSDDKLLAFLRGVHGRNGLWVRRLSTNDTTARTGSDRQIAGPEYDVREASFFPDKGIVFSSRHGGRFRLYKASVDSGVIQEMNIPSCSARYPVVSPNGEWMAFSCEQGGTWQLEVMNLNSRKQIRLTNADCNSISPAWNEDSKDLIYATDCGRGLGLTALARLHIFR
jgi:hypothetical protein